MRPRTQLYPLITARRFVLRSLQRPIDGWVLTSQFLRGLLVAAVPFASVAIGLALYRTVPQAQDLFLEVVGGRFGGLLFWAAFYAVAILAWVVPVYYSSRWILARYNGLARQAAWHTPVEPWVEMRIPPLLATLCLVAILLGQWGGIVDSPRTGYACAATVDGSKSDCVQSIERGRSFFKWLERREEPIAGTSTNENNSSNASWNTLIAVSLAEFLLVAGLFLAWGLLGLNRLSAYIASAILASLALRRSRRLARTCAWLGAASLLVLALFYLPLLPLTILRALVLFALPGWLFFASIWVDFSLATGVDTPRNILNNVHDRFGAPPCTPEDLINYAYNSVGGPGVVVVIAVLLAWPLLFAGLWWAKRRCRTIQASGLRISLRLTLWLLLMLLVSIGYLAIKIVWLMRPAILEALRDQFSIYELLLLPVVSLALALVVWLLLSAHSRRFSSRSNQLKSGGATFGALLALSVACIVTIIAVDPLELSGYIYRAPLLPILLGLWIPPLTLLSLWSRQTRMPLLLGLVFVAAVIPWVSGDNDEIRVIQREAQGPQAVRPTLDESLERWAKVNNCRPANAQAGLDCPAPIIVLASGGASRAAFKALELLGDLIDKSEEIRAGSVVPSAFRPFEQRLIAISGVSGGSLAAVTFQAALAESLLRRGGAAALPPPCLKDRKESLWYGNEPGQAASPDIRWRECLQLLVSADFLSPAVLTLAGSDLLNIRSHGDRAAILERAWERHFQRITGADMMAHALIAIRQKVLNDNERNWLPHLFLNGTSVTTGRRIVTTDLDAGQLFTDAYDLHGLLNEPGAKSCRSCDIALSTGATMSARFPVLSPHGTVRNADGMVADRVVDGGYFENYGAVTAQELVAALRDRGLNPIILLITNEPTQAAMPCVDDPAPLELPQATESTTLAVFSSPISALLGTRGARGTLASAGLCRMVKSKLVSPSGTILPAGDFLHIGVPLDEDILGVKQLSMSWWLSKYVQRKLANPEPNEATIVQSIIGAAPLPRPTTYMGDPLARQ
jgi:hypothetical protein